MKNKLQLLMLLLLAAPTSYAQTASTDSTFVDSDDEFTITESQLGEDEDMTSDIIQVGSANNIYASQIGYTWGGSMRFKFRALDNRYSDVYMNGVQVNNAETGLFNFSTVGGMNDATRNKDVAAPFEDNSFGISSIGSSSNYDFRAGHQATGHKVTLSARNAGYTARAMYTFGTGMRDNGWAFFGTIGYRWANMNSTLVDGVFYNSASYFLSLQKQFNQKHSLNIATWGSPTERASQGPTVDEARWLANDYQYNPYWGYQNGKKRSSRVVHNFEPTALMTWDYNINDKMKLTTSALFRYVMYSNSSLSYNDAQNPAADYWKKFPSAKFSPWEDNIQNWDYSYQEFMDAYNYWQVKANRQIQWDELYAKNQGRNEAGEDAAYYLLRRHNDHMTTNIGSTFNWDITPKRKFNLGLQLGSNKGMHYQTIDDMMGANSLHNINNYAIGKYTEGSDEVQYDLRHPNKEVGEGDKFGYNYHIYNQSARLWSSYIRDLGISHNVISGKIGGTEMWRNGQMQNGICKDFSYGKSKKAYFLEGGFKAASTLNLGKGNALSFGVGYEANAPKASKSFAAPEMNNNFVGGIEGIVNMLDADNQLHSQKIKTELKTEKQFSADLGYAYNGSWFRLNVNGFYYHMFDVTEYQPFYDDEKNSFCYNSLTGVTKDYYGAEIGAKFRVTNNFDIILLGTYSDAKYMSNAIYTYTRSIPQVITKDETNPDICYSKGMREGGTPLAAASLTLNYRIKGWYLSLTGNYYDRIYLSFAPNQRTSDQVLKSKDDDISGEKIYYLDVPAQAKGKGGFMLDASIGHQFRFKNNKALSVNLNMSNLTNNRKIVTGGFEQSRKNYSALSNGGQGNKRVYDFSKNPRKFYALGFNYMLNLNYRF